MGLLSFNDDIGGSDSVLEIIESNNSDSLLFKKSGTEVAHLNKYGELITTSGYDHRTAHIPIGDIAADYGDNDYLDPLFIAYKPVTIERLRISVDTTVSSDSSNYQSMAFKDSDGNTIATITTEDGYTLATPSSSATLDSTHKVLTAGEGIYLDITKAGSGMALSGLVVHLEYSINETASSSITAENQVINSRDTNGIITSDQTVRDHLSVKEEEGGDDIFNVSLEGIITQPNAQTRYFSLVHSAGDITAADDDDKVCVLLYANGKLQIEKIYIGAKEDHAADDDSNYEKIDFKINYTSKIGSILIGGTYAAGTALTQGIFSDVGTIEEKQGLMESGDYLSAHFTKTGTGENIAGLYFVVVYRKLD